MQPKLGLLVGGGPLPRILIERLKRSGRDIFVLAFRGQADHDAILDVPHAWVRLGAAGKTISLLHAAGVVDIMLVGTISKPGMLALMPDFRALSILKKIGGLGQGDNALFTGLIGELEGVEGFRVVGVDDVAPDLLAKDGPYGSLRPDTAAMADLRQAAAAALDVGARDEGQGAIVRDGRLIATEDRSGTDAMLVRVVRDEPGARGGVLVKTLKPGQERRVDLPTVGPATVEGAARAGLVGIAIESGAALVLDPAELGRVADRAGVFVLGIDINDLLEGEA